MFVANDVEAMRYTGTDDAVTAARLLSERVPLAVVTCGGRGVVAVGADDGLVEVPALRVPVRDPTGAGDVFIATFMAALQHKVDLRARLRFAGLCAALSVTGLGGAASAPRLADLAHAAHHLHSDGDWSFVPELQPTF